MLRVRRTVRAAGPGASTLAPLREQLGRLAGRTVAADDLTEEAPKLPITVEHLWDACCSREEFKLQLLLP